MRVAMRCIFVAHAPRSISRIVLRMLAASVLLLVTSAALCGPSVPQPDLCTAADSPSITAMQLGQATLDDIFVPWQQGQAVPVVYGPQGSPMIAMRMRIQGENAGCIAQHTRIVGSAGEPVVADEQLLLQAYRQDDDSYITDTHWVVMYRDTFTGQDMAATVETTIGTTTVSQSVLLDL